MMKQLLVATHNQGKVREYAAMLADLDVAWLSLNDAGVTHDVAETGTSFHENAALKAQAYARQTGLLTLADDSGLEVDALEGAPGVHTARYGGAGLTYAQRYHLLLQALRDVAWEARGARFRCVIALADGDGALLGTADGACPGLIALEPAGVGGFGYDPVFYLPDFDKTMAEVSPAVKNRISHRARAMAEIAPLLRRALGA